MNKVVSICAVLSMALTLSCGGDDGGGISGSTNLVDLSEADAVTICEEHNATVEAARADATKDECYSRAIQAFTADNTVNCEAVAAACIANPPSDIIGTPVDCSGDLVGNLGTCTATVQTVRDCDDMLVTALSSLAEGLDCANYITKQMEFMIPSSCVTLTAQCPNF